MVFDDYRKIKQIGEGGSGIVYEAISLITGDTVALKIITYAKEEYIQKEIRILNELKRKCTCHLNCVIEYGKTGKTPLQTYIVLEYIKGIPAKHFKPKNWKQFYNVMDQLIIALATMHSMDIVHLDIHGENVIVNPKTGETHLIDFGLSCGNDSGCISKFLKQYHIQSYVKTKDIYLLEDGKKYDVKQMGSVIFYILSGSLDDIVGNEETLADNIWKAIDNSSFKIPERHADRFMFFLFCMLRLEDSRITIYEARNQFNTFRDQPKKKPVNDQYQEEKPKKKPKKITVKQLLVICKKNKVKGLRGKRKAWLLENCGQDMSDFIL